jgi:predicted amidohydrolase
MATIRVAAIQMRSGISVERNIDEAERLIREAAAAGARYCLTPEMTNILDRDRERLMASVAAEEEDTSLERLQGLAAELGIHVHAGSMAFRLPSGVSNRSLLIGPDGGIITRYDKIHMFDVDLAGGESYRESRLYKPGGTAKMADLLGTRLGLSICYDVRFPHLYRALAKAGAAVISVPAAFTKTTGEAHWHVLLRARAIENGAFIIAAAQGGHHEDGRDTYGHSMIVDPWGRIVAEAGTEPGVVIAEIDPAESGLARGRIPSLANERVFIGPELAGAPQNKVTA